MRRACLPLILLREEQPVSPPKTCRLSESICMHWNWLLHRKMLSFVCGGRYLETLIPLVLLPCPKCISVILRQKCTYFVSTVLNEMCCSLGNTEGGGDLGLSFISACALGLSAFHECFGQISDYTSASCYGAQLVKNIWH